MFGFYQQRPAQPTTRTRGRERTYRGPIIPSREVIHVRNWGGRFSGLEESRCLELAVERSYIMDHVPSPAARFDAERCEHAVLRLRRRSSSVKSRGVRACMAFR